MPKTSYFQALNYNGVHLYKNKILYSLLPSSISESGLSFNVTGLSTELKIKVNFLISPIQYYCYNWHYFIIFPNSRQEFVFSIHCPDKNILFHNMNV